ncbi:MAG: cysteine desulfurase [Clostridia bacterium]|nr:cysteine desulfurase [Clostridia bacterium]
MIYFDNAASAPLCREAKEAMAAELERFANPSSLHRLGFEAEKRLKAAREAVAGTLSCEPEELFFTSGGTEADNLAVLAARRGGHILAGNSEHPAVAECLKALENQGCTVTFLSTKNGALDPAEVAGAVTEKTVLALMMHTNNETGARYDVGGFARIVKEKNPRCLVFSDGVQGYLKTPLSPASLGVDMLSLSAHKIGGPKGVGALWVRRGVHPAPRALGGGQEKGVRSGTENLPGIIGFAAAASANHARLAENIAGMAAVREAVLTGLRDTPGITFNVPCDPAPHILSMQVAGWRSEVLLHALSEKEIFVSSGSACSSHKGRGPVLANFGLSKEEADRTIRLSFSPQNTVDEAAAFCVAIKKLTADG